MKRLATEPLTQKQQRGLVCCHMLALIKLYGAEILVRGMIDASNELSVESQAADKCDDAAQWAVFAGKLHPGLMYAAGL